MLVVYWILSACVGMMLGYYSCEWWEDRRKKYYLILSENQKNQRMVSAYHSMELWKKDFQDYKAIYTIRMTNKEKDVVRAIYYFFNKEI